MPSGRTHDRITLWVLPLIGGLTLTLTRSSTLTLILCAGFLFGGLMLGPDLDIRSIQYKRWGWLRWIWIPYRGSMRHRSPLSHSPITGTMIRMLYLLVWVGLAGLVTLAILNEVWHMGWTWDDQVAVMERSLTQYRIEWLAAGVGLELGALSHYLADWGLSTYKRFKVKGWQALKPPPLWAKPVKTSKRRKSKATISSKPSRKQMREK